MQPVTMLPALSDTVQTISFSEEDGVCSSEIYSSNVVVSTNAGNHNHGSSKVKLKNLVDYNWEPKLYTGQLLAVHMSGKFLAYAIKAPNANNPGSWTGMVRVVHNSEPGSDRRALIKGMKGEVQDLAFAHIRKQVVLACIDELGYFYVYEIESTDSGLRCTLVAEKRTSDSSSIVGGQNSHHIVWCPYIPDDEDALDDEIARLLLTTSDNIARMWTVCGGSAGAERWGEWGGEAGGPLSAAAFSPDGTALATAGLDGHVLFYQVHRPLPAGTDTALPDTDTDTASAPTEQSQNGINPRCLHKWQPHGGKPLSCLFFLDNHKIFNTDVQFWKFAVTGADNNTVIRIWSCKTWQCLQTITFAAPSDARLGLRINVDASANYLLLSDFRARTLYVLHMARDSDDMTAYCKSISEFLLPYPVLSFCIVDAEEEVSKCESRCDDPFHRAGDSPANRSPDEFDMHEAEMNNSEYAQTDEKRVRIRMYIVQPKGLQEGELVYQPLQAPAPVAAGAALLQQQSQQLKNLLLRAQPAPTSSPSLPVPLNLMTPDAFSSPGKREDEDPPLSVSPDMANLPLSTTGGQSAIGLMAAEGVGATSVSGSVSVSGRGEVARSGGSSPSREVCHILAHSSRGFYPGADPEAEEEDVDANVIADIADSAPPVTEVAAHNGDLFSHDALYEPPAELITERESSWPQISLAQISEANQRKASADKPAITRLAENSRLDAIEAKLDKLTELVCAQSAELVSLQQEVPRPLQDALAHAAHATAAAVEDALSAGWNRISRLGETASSRAAQAAGVGAARALEPLAAALQHQLAAKLSATDSLLRDNIEKLVTSKTVMENLSTSIATSLSEMVRKSFQDALFKLLPAMEETHAQMFKQINTAFQNGTKEFIANTEAAARLAAEKGSSAATAALSAAVERQAASHSAALHDVAKSVLEKEMSWWRGQVAQASPAPSRAPSAHPMVDHKQIQAAQIQALVSSGSVERAFQLALSAADLALVVAACRAAPPAAVFGPPCALPQHVLLSLVQQLAADLHSDTALKQRYLEEAIMNLDPSSPITREHLPNVVQSLKRQIRGLLTAQPTHPLARQLRVLLMAAESLLHSA